MSLVRVLGVLLIAGGSVLTLPLGSVSAATVNVPVSGTIGQTWYCTSTYESSTCPTNINTGDTVNWVFNGDIYSSHTTTHCGASCSSPTATPLWDSPVMQVGNYSYVFNTPGTYLYYCEVHGTQMLGSVTVAGGVGGQALLADVGSAVRQPSDGLVSIWLGVAAMAGGMIMLIGAAWVARGLVAEEPPS